MATIFSKQNANSYLTELANTDSATARLYLLQYGYSSSSFEMPEYYGAQNLEHISLARLIGKTKNHLLLHRSTS